MSNHLDFNLSDLKLKAINTEAQLVVIPVDAEYGVVAVVKSIGGGKAACVVFAPATKLAKPFANYRPTYLRKLLTTDLPLREGRWRSVTIDHPNATVLGSAVETLIRDFEKIDPAQVVEINMNRPTNISSAPEIASATYRTPEHTPIERALAHLVGLEFTKARAIIQEQAEAQARAIATELPSIPEPEGDATQHAPVLGSIAPLPHETSATETHGTHVADDASTQAVESHPLAESTRSGETTASVETSEENASTSN